MSSPAARSRPRIWAFRLLSVAGALLLVLGLELLLRLFGVGQAFRLVEAVPGQPRRLTSRLNAEIDAVYFGSQPMFGPEPRRFDLPKPAGTYRILFLGASTVIGFPYPPELAFPRQVEVLLEAQQPGLDVEALNAGITAINSFEIADLAGYAADCEPDLVVIHAGHNEFFGPGGPGSSVLPLPPALVRTTFTVRRTRIGQAVSRLLQSSPDTSVNPLQKFPRLTGIRLTDPEFSAAVANYRANLEMAVDRLRAAGLPVLLTTVASNLRDQSPIQNVWPVSLAEADISRAKLRLQEAEQLLGLDQAAAALEVLRSLPTAVHSSAHWQYRYAQALEATGEKSGAAEAYRLARDYDGCRFRAASRFGEIVRELAQQRQDPGVQLLDLEQRVAEAAASVVPGEELFLEHVHYNLTGHRLLATHLARHILGEMLSKAWSVERELSDEAWNTALGFVPEDEVAALSFALEAVQTPPLAGALDAELLEADLQSRIRNAFSALDPSRQDCFADLTMHQLQHDLIGGLVESSVRRQQLGPAAELSRLGTVRQPWDSDRWRDLADVHQLAGNVYAGEMATEKLLELSPGHDDAE